MRFKIYVLFFFLENLLKLWRHFKENTDVIKNDLTEQILIWYCVLRVTHTNLSILNQLC